MRLFSTKRTRWMDAVKRVPGVIVYFPMNEVSGTETKNYAPANIGSVNGAVTGLAVGQSGKIGRSYSLDKTGDYVTVASSAVDIGVFTYIALVNPTNANEHNTIRSDTKASGTRAPKFKINNSNKLELDEQGVALIGESTGTITNAIWTYVSVSYTSAGVYTFNINGLDSGTGTALRAFEYTDLRIGNSPDVGEDFLGKMQHFIIANRALSASEHRRLAHFAGFI